MKKIFLIVILLNSIVYAKGKEFANVCDSLSKICLVPNTQLSTIICNNIYKSLAGYSVAKNELFSYNKIDDSTIVATGSYVIKKTETGKQSPIYGYYFVPYHSDGLISFRLLIHCKSGKYKYEIDNLNHYGCRFEYGPICNKDSKDKVVNGLKILFLYRVAGLIDIINKANEKNEW